MSANTSETATKLEIERPFYFQRGTGYFARGASAPAKLLKMHNKITLNKRSNPPHQYRHFEYRHFANQARAVSEKITAHNPT